MAICTFGWQDRRTNQIAACLWETPTGCRTAAGWGQYTHSCCHGYPRWPSTGSGIWVSGVKTDTRGIKEGSQARKPKTTTPGIPANESLHEPSPFHVDTLMRYPCFPRPILSQYLAKEGVSWKRYHPYLQVLVEEHNKNQAQDSGSRHRADEQWGKEGMSDPPLCCQVHGVGGFIIVWKTTTQNAGLN